MNRKYLTAGLAAGALVAAGLAGTLPTASAASGTGSVALHPVRVCSAHPAPGFAACMSLAMAGPNGKIVRSAKPLAAFTPSDIQAAYNLTGLKSGGRTVAIVDAFGYPTLESDLAYFRNFYGLSKCTTGNGCLTILDQRGGHSTPPTDPNWDLEQALDLDMVSSACPDCKILIVQSDSNSFKNLSAAENTAAAQKGVVAISNSYGGGDGANRGAYSHKGIAITASTGDSGYQGGSAPASFTHVVAVGGTAVTKDGSKRGYSETAWSGAGSGCSTKNKAPKFQIGVTSCGKFDGMADVSGAAAPAAGGLNIYYNGRFIQVGGTSESSPLVASVFGLSGKVTGWPGKFLYKNPGDLYDVTSGSNGSCGAPLCQAGPGWDGPTGLGTPNGIGAF